MVRPLERHVASRTLPRAPSGVPGVWLSGLVEPRARGLVVTCPSSRFPGRLPGATRLKPFVTRLPLGRAPCLQTSPLLTSSVTQGWCRYPSSNERVFTQDTLMLFTLNRT